MTLAGGNHTILGCDRPANLVRLSATDRQDLGRIDSHVSCRSADRPNRFRQLITETGLVERARRWYGDRWARKRLLVCGREVGPRLAGVQPLREASVASSGCQTCWRPRIASRGCDYPALLCTTTMCSCRLNVAIITSLLSSTSRKRARPNSSHCLHAVDATRWKAALK